MSNKIMKTLNIGGNTYEIVDENARNDIMSLKKINEETIKIIRKEGILVQENCVENMGIAVSANIVPKQEGTGDPYPAGAGKNKLNITAVSTTSNGITYTVKEDGSIICNGTNTVLDTFVLSREMIPTGNYRLLGCPVCLYSLRELCRRRHLRHCGAHS